MARNRGAAVAAPAGGDSVTTQRMRIPTNGPHDGDTLAPEITPAPGTVDFGAVRVPVPVGGMVSVEPTTAGRIQAVHVTVPEGRLSVSALAAPRNEGLWAELATEIDASLREGGARVRSFTGEWGRELHATTDGATSVFVGVDGPRWMLYGVATGPTRDAVSLDARLRRMLRGTVVVRGKAPYPVRTVLPLVTPSGAGVEEQAATSAPPTMTLRAPAAAALGEAQEGPATAASQGIHDASAPTNGAMTFGGPLAASTNGATNGAVNGAANGSANGVAYGVAAGGVTNGVAAGGAANGVAAGGAANGVAAGGAANGAAANDATTGVFRRNGASRRGASTAGATRKDVPPRGASATGASRTGASRTGATPADIPGAAGPVPPPRSARRRQAATAPGVPFPGQPTNGAPRPGATATGGAGPDRTGANGRGPASGTSRSGANRAGANHTGVNQIGVPPGANHGGAATGANQIGVPTGYNPAGAATTGTNRIGVPPGTHHAGAATTGANRIGVPPGTHHAATTGANQIGAPGTHRAGAATTGTNQIGPPTGAHYTDPAVAGPGRPGASTGANNIGGNYSSSPTDATWSGAYPPGAPADPGISPYGMPTNDAPLHRPAPGAPVHGAPVAAGLPGMPPGAVWDGGRPAAPPWSPTPGAMPSGTATGSYPLGGPTASGSYPTPASADAAPRPETNGAPLGLGGFSRPDVPAAWAHETGVDRRPAVGPVADGGSATPAPITHHEPAQPHGSSVTGSYSPRPEIPRFTSGPAADRRSWADAAPSDRDAAEHWDPLVDPLPIDLEPLPAPDRGWTDDRSGGSNGRLDTAFTDSTAASRGGRQDADKSTNGATARRWLAADLLRDRNGDDSAVDDSAVDDAVGDDYAVGDDSAVDDAVGDDTARRWRAADLLVGRNDTHGAGDSASPKWRAADLLSDRNGGNAVPRSQGAGVPAGRNRYGDDVEAAASGRGNDREDADQAGYGTQATRWLAADLLDGSGPAVEDRTRRRRATEPSERRPVNGHAEPRRRATAPDDGPGIGDDGTRWRAADLLNGGTVGPYRASSPAAQQAADLPHGRNHADTSTGSRWRAAELLDAGGSSAATTGAEPRRRVADLLYGRGESSNATTGTPSRRRASDLLGHRGNSSDATTGTPSRRRAAGSPDSREDSARATTHAEPGRRVADRLEGRNGDTGAGGDSRWRAASLLEGGAEFGGAETATTNPWETGTAHDRPTDGDLVDDPPARKWRAADLLDGNGETGGGVRPRRARTPDTGPATEGASAPLPGASAGRRRRSESTPATPSRHGGENTHAGSPSRVPPTQWAWPKEPTAPSEPRAADTGSRTAWSASDLLDEGKHAGGRRRSRESARHGEPTDDDAGRHYRP